jgi:hypothetical protein
MLLVATSSQRLHTEHMRSDSVRWVWRPSLLGDGFVQMAWGNCPSGQMLDAEMFLQKASTKCMMHLHPGRFPSNRSTNCKSEAGLNLERCTGIPWSRCGSCTRWCCMTPGWAPTKRNYQSPPVVDENSARHVQWLGQGHPGKRQTAEELHAFL